MPLPTTEQLVQDAAGYTQTGGATTYLEPAVAEAVEYLNHRFPPVVNENNELDPPAGVGLEQWKGEAIRLAADLFWRRQAQNGVVGVNALDGMVTRVAVDPFAASDKRTQRWTGLGFA